MFASHGGRVLREYRSIGGQCGHRTRVLGNNHAVGWHCDALNVGYQYLFPGFPKIFIRIQLCQQLRIDVKVLAQFLFR